MVPKENGVRGHRHRIPRALVDVGLTRMGRRVDRHLAPQLRGRLTPRILDALERDGWHVHQIGQAVYIHGGGRGDHHLIFGVWPRRADPPAWAARLGQPSAGYERRLERVTAEQGWRRMARDLAGRFAYRLAWYHWPRPAAYRFESLRPGWLDQERADAVAHNARIRLERWAR